MSADAPEDSVGSVEASEGAGSLPATGDARVDEVLESLSDLEDIEIDGHPAHFATAHDTLRQALASPPGDAVQDG